MKVKRYFAQSMRSALDMVKQEQGPDVLILSNRKVDGGIELVTADGMSEQELAQHTPPPRAVTNTAPVAQTAISRELQSPVQKSFNNQFKDRPSAAEQSTAPSKPASPKAFSDDVFWTDNQVVEQMRDELSHLKSLLESQLSGFAWADFGGRHPLRARLLRALSQLGLSPRLSRQLVNEVPDEMDYQAGWHRVLALLITRMQVLDDPIIKTGGAVALLGPTGVGKSTLVSKLAARFALTHGPEAVAIVSLDDHRLGAHQQMSAFGRLIGATVYPLKGVQEMFALSEEFEQRRLVLIDTPGLAPDDQRYFELAASLADFNADISLYNVFSATTDYFAAAKVVAATQDLSLNGCVLTKLDEAATLGSALSAIVESDLPLAYISDGQQVPDDLHAVSARQLIERMVALAGETPRHDAPEILEQAFSA